MSSTPDGGFLDVLRPVSLVAIVVGAVGSLGFMFRFGAHAPRLLLVIFFFWILAPFAAIAWAHRASTRWSAPTRATLYAATVLITLGSLAAYGGLIAPPSGSPAAFVFVAVPPVSTALLAAAVAIAALVSRPQSRRGAGA